MSRFAKLEKACGGSINPESLEEFELAMCEYKEFMSGMRELLAPVKFMVNGEVFNSRAFAEAYAAKLFKVSGVVAGVEKVRA